MLDDPLARRNDDDDAEDEEDDEEEDEDGLGVFDAEDARDACDACPPDWLPDGESRSARSIVANASSSFLNGK